MRNLKRALSLALASVMLLGMMVVGTSADYADVTSTHNKEAIAVAQAAGIMIGDDAGNFNPDQKVTRNEAAVVLANLMGYKVSDFAGIAPFTDVPAWAEAYVSACYANNIVAGTSATTYGGNETVTAAQFALMVMKTLGYFQNSGDFADDWKLAAVKQASKIELLDGVDASADTALTRNDVAQVVLTALECAIVEHEGAMGTDITTSDGTSITIGYESKYEPVVYGNTYKYDNVADGEQQLAEKLFKNKLQKRTVTDDFQRPATEWTFKNESVGKFAKEADATYTKKVDSETIYADAGLAAQITASVYEDGESKAGFTLKEVDDTNKIGDNGILTQVYVTKDTATGAVTAVKIVKTTYTAAKITAVTKNDKDERVVKIGSKEYKTEGFEKDQWVMITEAAGKIQTMEAIEKVTGRATKKAGSVWTIDGTKYTENATGTIGSVTIAADVDYYLDANGFILKLDAASDAVNLDNLAYVIDVGSDRGTAWAALRLTDGTKKVVDTDKLYDGTDGDNMETKVVMFKDTKDGVKLTTKGTTTTSSIAPFTKGDLNFDGIDLTSKTVFTYIVDGKASTYTGYKNAPTTNATRVGAYVNSDSETVWVYVETASITDESTLLTLVAYDADVAKVVEDDGVEYYEYNAIVDGEVTTIKIDADAAISGHQLTKDVTVDADGLVTINSTVSKGTGTAIKAGDEVVTIGSTRYSYVDDVAVYVVSKDFEVSIATIADIQKDDDGDYNPYAAIWFVTKDAPDTDVLKNIVLFEQ